MNDDNSDDGCNSEIKLQNADDTISSDVVIVIDNNESVDQQQTFKTKCVNSWSNNDIIQWFNSLPKEFMQYKVCIIYIN